MKICAKLSHANLIFVFCVAGGSISFLIAAMVTSVAMVTASSSIAVVNLLTRGIVISWKINKIQ